jgi:hypothetical protein
MTKSVYVDDESLAAALRDLYASELERARADALPLDVVVAVQRGTIKTRPSRGLAMTSLAVARLVVLAVLVFNSSATTAPGVGSTPTAEASRETQAPPSPSAVARSSPVVGPLLDGIPVTLNGEPVLRGSGNIAKRFEDLSKAQAFLAGGWFHAGQPERFCPAYLAGTPWSFCSTFELYELPHGGTAVWIYPGDPPKVDPAVPIAADRGVVLRIHTHDASCTPEVSDCISLPVLVEVVWLGPSS